MARTTTAPTGKTVEALRHEEATRRNIPTTEYQSVLEKEAQDPVRVAFEWRAGFNQHWGYAPEAVKLWDRFEREVVSRFTAYQPPAIELDKRTPKEAVCLVFEKVNTVEFP